MTLVILVSTGIAFFIGSLQDHPPYRDEMLTARVERQDLKVELHVLGVLDASQSHVITSQLQGSEGKIIYLVEDGAKVSQGDLLVRFDPAPFQKQVEQLRTEVSGFEAAVQAAQQTVEFEKNQVEQEVANAQYQFNVAKLELKKLEEGEGPLQQSQFFEEVQKAKLEMQRYQQYSKDLEMLQEEGYDNSTEIAKTREKVEMLAKQYRSAAGRYENYTENVLPALIESGRAKLSNAQLAIEQIRQGGRYRIAKTEATLSQIQSKLNAQKEALQRAKTELAKTEIEAPFDGIVIHFETFREREKRKPRVGDTVFMNQPILYLPDIAKMIVKTKIREIDLYKIAIGQTGRVRVDAYPKTSFTGHLNFIGALATSDSSQPGDEKYFQVGFVLEGEDKRLRPGMSCRISIRSNTVLNAITVPVQAVFTQNDISYCYVVNSEGGYTRQQVVVGAHDNDLIEIVEGLQEGELVSLVHPEQ